jgi:site-specific recombinase XerD
MTRTCVANVLVSRDRCEGPLDPYIDGFGALLHECGYASLTRKVQLRIVEHFSRWLGRRRIDVDDLDEEQVRRFVRDRHRRGHLHRGDRPTLRTLLGHLQQLGVIRAPTAPQPPTALSALEQTFSLYLTHQRGLPRATRRNYLPMVHRFLSERFGTDSICVSDIRPPDITRFVARHAHAGSPSRARWMVTALRSFFRFLRLTGATALDLASSVPSVADWRRATVPRRIAATQVEQLLKHCDQHTVLGQRDYTILLLLARLGLRAGEVVGLTMDDIDWDAGELIVRGKGGRGDRFPLTRDVGKALATYLRHGRPPCTSRRIFICAQAPRRGFTSCVAVCTIVRRAWRRAGLHPPSWGAHLLRHTLATEMLRRGASLTEIGEILRHHHPDTTAIYAKVDLQRLQAIAPPWPGGVA